MAGRGADMRSRLNSAIDEIDDEKIQGLVKNAFEATRRVSRRVYCPHCGKGEYHDIEIPDSTRGVEALVKLLDQAKGKPAETRRVEVDITARTIGELEGMTDAQLAELASAEEGQWELMPPQPQEA